MRPSIALPGAGPCVVALSLPGRCDCPMEGDEGGWHEGLLLKRGEKGGQIRFLLRRQIHLEPFVIEAHDL